FAASAFVAAIANAALLIVDPGSLAAPLLRFVTGMCMAGVYPVGMKLATTWATDDMGFMVGLLVGALTLGSAAPHLFSAFGGVDCRDCRRPSGSDRGRAPRRPFRPQHHNDYRDGGQR